MKPKLSTTCGTTHSPRRRQEFHALVSTCSVRFFKDGRGRGIFLKANACFFSCLFHLFFSIIFSPFFTNSSVASLLDFQDVVCTCYIICSHTFQILSDPFRIHLQQELEARVVPRIQHVWVWAAAPSNPQVKQLEATWRSCFQLFPCFFDVFFFCGCSLRLLFSQSQRLGQHSWGHAGMRSPLDVEISVCASRSLQRWVEDGRGWLHDVLHQVSISMFTFLCYLVPCWLNCEGLAWGETSFAELRQSQCVMQTMWVFHYGMSVLTEQVIRRSYGHGCSMRSECPEISEMFSQLKVIAGNLLIVRAL